MLGITIHEVFSHSGVYTDDNTMPTIYRYAVKKIKIMSR